ncbi:hypothetical protein GCM10011572_25570 [Pseudoduganella buxea]|uniref:Uncharacterized protein n=1 Tax=Pseudoduganella buxea TaxID=1949069 RepID=A0ABQ1KJP9_9BURK|nr:hypothetical protein GCM10011572_25570 [Pseudoduganella buxea]
MSLRGCKPPVPWAPREKAARPEGGAAPWSIRGLAAAQLRVLRLDDLAASLRDTRALTSLMGDFPLPALALARL